MDCREAELPLSNLEIKCLATRDEQQAAGYAALMDLVFTSLQDGPFTTLVKSLRENGNTVVEVLNRNYAGRPGAPLGQRPGRLQLNATRCSLAFIASAQMLPTL